jgi:TfoX/Sxy family transcriptional regulator of competence genes
MPYDEDLAARLRMALSGRAGVVEKKMFGGLTFMLNDRMCCGVVKDDLVFRVGPDGYEEVLKLPGARPMDFTGRPMKGMVYVSRAGIASEKDLAAWVQRAVKFADSLN